MPVLRHFASLALTVTLVSILAGCDTFGINLGGPAAPAAPTGRAIAYATDDLTGMIFAVDAPSSLRLLPSGSVLTLDVSTAEKGAKHVKATLTPADGDAIDGSLPPPAAGRTYFLLGLGAKDKATVAAAQKWIRGLPDGTAPVIDLEVVPKLCGASGTDASAVTYSVTPALPGATLLPIVSNAPVAGLLPSGTGQLPVCG